MNAASTLCLDRLAQVLIDRLTVEIEASGRHVHLCRRDLEALFGPGYELSRVKDLSQPGQFACAERVTLEGPKGQVRNVVILGPVREESQVEISLTDAVALGITPPVRLSGDVQGTPGITLRHGERTLCLDRGLMVSKRHIHMTPRTRSALGCAAGRRSACGASPAAPWCWRGWRPGCPPNSLRRYTSTTMKPTPAGFARGTGD